MSLILELQSKLLDTSAELAKLERTAVRDPLSKSVDLNHRSLQKRQRELEKQFLCEADRIGSDVCSYRLFADDLHASIETVSGTLGGFQDLVSVVYEAIKSQTPKTRGRISAESVKETTFEFGYSFAGSLGIVLMVPNERMLGDVESRLDNSIHTVIEMMQAEDPKRLLSYSKRLGTASVRALYRWALPHVTGGVGAAFDWQRNQETKLSHVMQLRQIVMLKEMIDQTSDAATESFGSTGILVGADLQRRSFHFRPDRGEDISGTFDDGIHVEGDIVLDKHYSVSIEKTTVTLFSTEKDIVTYKLNSLHRLTD